MNRNITAIILLVLSAGIYFTFTRHKIDELKDIRAVNSQYEQAIADSAHLIEVRDNIKADYEKNINDSDKQRLNKIVPNNVDNVRLIIDVKDDIAARHGLSLKNIKTSSPVEQKQTTGTIPADAAVGADGQPVSVAPVDQYGIVTLSFDVTTTYQTFVDFLKDLESSLRIMDVSKLTIEVNENGTYNFGVEVKTYWLKQ